MENRTSFTILKVLIFQKYNSEKKWQRSWKRLEFLSFTRSLCAKRMLFFIILGIFIFPIENAWYRKIKGNHERIQRAVEMEKEVFGKGQTEDITARVWYPSYLWQKLHPKTVQKKRGSWIPVTCVCFRSGWTISTNITKDFIFFSFEKVQRFCNDCFRICDRAEENTAMNEFVPVKVDIEAAEVNLWDAQDKRDYRNSAYRFWSVLNRSRNAIGFWANFLVIKIQPATNLILLGVTASLINK